MGQPSTPYVLAIFLGALPAACGSDDEKNQDPGGAQVLLSQIQADDYRTWARAPGFPDRTPSQAPHGGAVDIFVNDVVTAALAGPAITAWPVGSIIAKDGYDGDALALIAVMEKREGGWFWAEYDGSGAPLYSGSPSVCTGCHGSGADSVRAFGFPQ